MFEMCFRSFLFWMIVGGKVRFLPFTVSQPHISNCVVKCYPIYDHLCLSPSASPGASARLASPLSFLVNMFMRILDWWTNTGFLSLADLPPTGLAASGQPGERLAPATCRHQENELRYPPNIFDLVILRETLMYLDREDKAVILRKIKQLLRRGQHEVWELSTAIWKFSHVAGLMIDLKWCFATRSGRLPEGTRMANYRKTP